MHLEKPLISIITVVFNNATGLQKTIQSTRNQTYKNIEHIVIDGGSKDGTLDVIHKNKDYLSYWVSEPDKGIYDAMNKGIIVAKGEWLNFMNAGDLFYDLNVLESLSQKLDNHYSIVYGNVAIDEKIKTDQELINSVGLVKMICHQSVFFNKQKFGKEAVLYNTKYRLCADLDLLLKLYHKNKDQFALKVDSPICIYEKGGVSDQDISLRLSEKAQIIKSTWSGNSRIKVINHFYSYWLLLRNYIARLDSN